MITTLWLLNLFLAANTLMLLAMLAYAWIYYDLFHQEGSRHNLWIAHGALLLAVGWLLHIFSLNYDSNLLIMLRFGFSTLGLSLLLLGVWREKQPGLPKLNIRANTVHSFLPIILVLLAPVNLILTGLICARLYRKISVGKSKQFTKLFVAWVLLLGYFLFEAMSGVATSGGVWLQELSRNYSTLWILAQVLLLLAALTLLSWIGSFLNFRVAAKIFVSIWQQLIICAIILACAYSVFTIHTAQNQMLTLLGHNIGLVKFDLDQIDTNNRDLLGYLSHDPAIQTGLLEDPAGLLASKSAELLRSNQTLDQIIFSNARGEIIYDSLDENQAGTFASSLLTQAVLENRVVSGFVSTHDLPAQGRLAYEVNSPVTRDDKLIGSITFIKYIDDGFLDLLQSQTGQEVLVYVDGSRAASTIVAGDQLSRLENLPLLTTNINISHTTEDVSFAEARILDTPYLISRLLMTTDSGVAEIMLATKQSILLASSQEALLYTFLLSVLLSILALVPCYKLARTLERSISA